MKKTFQFSRQKKLAAVFVALTATALTPSAGAINAVGGYGLESVNVGGTYTPLVNAVGGYGLE